MRTDPDPDVRYLAVEALAEIGDLTVVDALRHISENDNDTDYEGFSIATMAKEALKRIHERTRTRTVRDS